MIQMFRQNAGQIAEVLFDPADEAGLDVEADISAAKLAHVLSALLASMRLDAIGGPMAREANRVAGILARDAEDAEAERARQAASIELDNGLTVNLVDTVVPPTPEWMAKTPVRSVYVGADNWTDRGAHEPVRTVRRVLTSPAERAFNAGRINEREKKACAWYREQHEMSGLAGNVPSTSFEPRIAGTAQSRAAFSPRQIEAQDELRNARLLVPFRLRAFFDKVVISEVMVSTAAKDTYAGQDPFDSLACCAGHVADYVEYSTGKPI